ncbi:MAG TPA: helix-turn-helix domain-containing protein [Planctomycetota bacterium]|nr:helix-turn-helix domain-containing protein [Planctomycetota bacterium]
MLYREVAPPPPLDGFVKCLWILEGPAPPPGAPADEIVPDGCPEIVFHHGDAFERIDGGLRGAQHRAAVVGQIEAPLAVRPTGRIGLLGVRFRPEGAAAILGVPAGEITARSLALDDLWGADGRRLEERVGSARDAGARLAAAASGLVARARVARRPERSRAAVDLCRRTRGTASVDDLARAAGVSGRHLERLFRDEVGLPPKTLSRILRFRAALTLLKRGAPGGPAGVAIDLGYADQAHLHRDFREFAGAPPGAFLRRPAGVADPFNS